MITYTTTSGDITIRGDLYRGRKVGERTIRTVDDCRSGLWVTFTDGTCRVFRPVNA